MGPTNNDPFVIAQYHLDCVTQTGGIPKIMRVDYGTENVNVALLQRFFHGEEKVFNGENRHLTNASRHGGVC